MLQADSFDNQTYIASIFFSVLTMAWFPLIQTSSPAPPALPPHVAHMCVHTKHISSSQSESDWLEDNLNASVTVIGLGTQQVNHRVALPRFED